MESCSTQKCLSCNEGYTLTGDVCYNEEQIKVKEACTNVTFDLTILVDGSGSVTAKNFQKSIDFVEDLVNFLDLSSGSAVTLDQFSFYFKEYADRSSNKTVLNAAIGAMRLDYQKHNTMTGQALNKIFKKMTKSPSDHAGHNEVLLILTDGLLVIQLKSLSKQIIYKKR